MPVCDEVVWRDDLSDAGYARDGGFLEFRPGDVEPSREVVNGVIEARHAMVLPALAWIERIEIVGRWEAERNGLVLAADEVPNVDVHVFLEAV
jgi:hypothetical protein